MADNPLLKAEIAKNAKIASELLARMEKHLEGKSGIEETLEGFKEEVRQLSDEDMFRAFLYISGKVVIDAYEIKKAVTGMIGAIAGVAKVGCDDPECPHCGGAETKKPRRKKKADSEGGEQSLSA